jgi:hypothetical protein
MKMKLLILAVIAIFASNTAYAHDRDREVGAAVALGITGLVVGAIIASQSRPRHHHYVAPPPPQYPPSLRYRYYEPLPAPSPYYHHPYRRHWH